MGRYNMIAEKDLFLSGAISCLMFLNYPNVCFLILGYVILVRFSHAASN